MFITTGTFAVTILVESDGPFVLDAPGVQLDFGESRLILLDGTLQASDAELTLTASYGRLTFTPSTASTIDVSSPSSTEYVFEHSGCNVAESGTDEYSVVFTVGLPAVLYFRLGGSGSPALPSLSVSGLWTYLYEGDFVGFANALIATTFNSLSIGIALITMIFLVPLYLRTNSLMLLVIVWLLLGGFLIVLFPEVSGLALIFMALGIGGLFFRLLRPSNS